MDNITSLPKIVTPQIPSDFEAKAGTSKTDFAKVILQLIAGAKITGIIQEQPSPFDLGAMQSNISRLESEVQKFSGRKIRRVFLNGIANGILTVPFQDIGTLNYSVDVAFVSLNTDLPDALMWSVIKDSRTTTQVQIRINGNAAPFGVEVTLEALDGVD